MQIEFSGNKREYSFILNKNKKKILNIISSGNFLQGKYNNLLESTVSKILKCKSYCKAIGSGTDGLYLTLSSINHKKLLKVGVPALTFVATANSILRAGHIPVIIDVNKNGLMNHANLKKKINELDVLIYVSLYGDNSEYPEIIKLLDKTNTILIEDAAQSDFPAVYYFPNIKPPYASILSFDPMKIFSAIGSGGMIISYDAKLRNYINAKTYHGRNKNFWGINSQLSELSAYCIIKKIEYHFLNWKNNRKKISEKIIKNLPYQVKNISKFSNQNAYHKLVLKFNNSRQRNLFQKHCKKNKIETKIHYKIPIHKNIKFKKYITNKNEFLIAENLSKTVITIPNHPLLTNKEVNYIIKTINKFYI